MNFEQLGELVARGPAGQTVVAGTTVPLLTLVTLIRQGGQRANLEQTYSAVPSAVWDALFSA